MNVVDILSRSSEKYILKTSILEYKYILLFILQCVCEGAINNKFNKIEY